MRICRLEECKAPFEPGPWAFRQEFCCQKHHDRYWYLQRKDEGEFQDRNERRREIRAHEENRKKVLEESGHDIGPWDFGTPEQRAAAKAKVKEMFPYKGPTLRRMNGHAVDGRYQKPQPTSYAGSKALTDKEVQRERLEHLLSDRSLLRQKGSTYHQRAVAEAVEERGGRFAALSKPQIVGSGPVMYPVQPPSSPWASDPVGVEPLIDATDCGPKLRRL